MASVNNIIEKIIEYPNKNGVTCHKSKKKFPWSEYTDLKRICRQQILYENN